MTRPARGTTVTTYDGGAPTAMDNGKCLVAWKRQPGEWKIHRDVSNVSGPAR